MEARLYYECHITINPIFCEAERATAEQVAKEFGFKLAELLMQKRKEDIPERSKYDTFMTAHSKRYGDILDRMSRCCTALQNYGFTVYRAKIEDTLFDTKHGDKL